MKKILFIFLIAYSTIIFSQNIKYAREVVSALSSPEFNGRGYTNKGDQLAAEYLKNELIKNGVKPLGDEYFQLFNINVNTIPSVKYLKIDDKILIPGEDYVICNNSQGCKGEFEIIRIDSSALSLKNLNCEGKFILFDPADFISEDSKKIIQIIKYLNVLKARGIIELTDKHPSQRMSETVDNFAFISLRKSAVDSLPERISLNFKNKMLNEYQTRNVAGYIEGEVDTFIMLGGHYDHLGNMGKSTYFPGANDNASGCSMLLNFADYYKSIEEKPHYSVIFVFFSAEEVGILGSKYFAENPLVPLSKIKFFFNLDLVGTGEEGIKVVNGTVYEKEFDLLCYINSENSYLELIGKRGEAMNSDHQYLYKAGVPSFFIYTLGGYSEYHNVYDIEETLLLTEYEDLFRLLKDFLQVCGQVSY